MNRLLSKLKLSWKLAVMLAVPLVALAWFAGSAALNAKSTATEARKVVDGLDVANKAAALTYEIQKERGWSSLYLPDENASDSDLRAQQATVDNVYEEFEQSVQRAEAAGALPSEFAARHAKLEQGVDSLGALRADVLGRKIKAADSGARYTEVIATVVETAAQAPNMVVGSEAARDAGVFVLMINAAESAGRQRALLVPAFVTRNLEPDKAMKATGLIAAEQSYVSTGKQTASHLGGEVMEAALASPQYAEIERLRKGALDGEFLVTGREFFDSVTAWVDRVSEAENAILEGLEGEAAAKAAAADSQFWTQAVIAVIVVLFSVGLAVVVAVATIRPMREITGVAETVATGDVDVEVSYEGRDEVGVLAESFRQLVAYVKDVAAAADALAAGDASKAVSVRGDADVLGRAFVSLQSTLDSLTGQIRVLVDAAKAGDLDARGDAAGYEGAYRDMVAGINETLEAMAGPVSEAQRVLARVSDRDLTARMDGRFAGAFADIKESMNRAVANLDDGLGTVAMSAGQVSGAAHQISGGASSLSAAATEQAASLEEISANLSELSAMAKSAAEQVHDAQGLASQSDRLTSEGADAMAELSDAIRRIKESSDATAGIVRTIDEIAFQTNLLSLNAAVEAARAGDAGKGFAVVAEEVRNLAMRSAEAAKNTAELIEGSVTHADAGVALNQKVSANLEEIGGAVRSINETMGQVAAATQEQTTGVGQISEAVEELNRLTQDNAAQAEEAAASSEELTAQSAEMASLAGAYHLSSSTDIGTPSRV